MMTPELSASPVTFHGSRFVIRTINTVGADGRPRPRDIIIHPGAVVILPMLDAQTVVLISNHRVSVNQDLWELPAGTLEPGEAPELCAGRELIEETGYEAGKIIKLCAFYSSPGFCNELLHCYVATGLKQVGQQLDAGETITPHPTPLDVTMDMVKDGRIRDGKTLATLLYYQAFGRES